MIESEFHKQRAFGFHTTLPEEDPNLRDAVAGPILRAAYRVMCYAHTNPKTGKLVSRKKEDLSIPYITHTIMVYNLMAAMGETDGVVLATALLHDALEDCLEFKNDHAAMHRMLIKEMQAEGVLLDDAEAYSSEIIRTCAQVKNRDARIEDKLKAQLIEIPHMGHEAKCLKILDQTASLIDHLLMANDLRLVPHYKSMGFAQKAHNLVPAIVRHETSIEDGEARPVEPEEQYQLAQLHGLFRQVQHYNRQLLHAKSPSAITHARKSFAKRIPLLFDKAHQSAGREEQRALNMRDDEVVTRIDFEKEITPEGPVDDDMLPASQSGICRLGLNRRNEVVRFTGWVAPEDSDQHLRNRKVKMLKELMEHFREVKMDDEELHSVKITGQEAPRMEGRRFILEFPMELDEFLKLAEHADAMTNDDIAQTRAVAVQRTLPEKVDWSAIARESLSSGRDTPGR